MQGPRSIARARLVEPLICTQALPAFEQLLRTAGFRAPFSWRRRGGADPESALADSPTKPHPPGNPGATAVLAREDIADQTCTTADTP